LIATTEREDNGQGRKIYLTKMTKGQRPSWSWVYGSWIYNYLCN